MVAERMGVDKFIPFRFFRFRHHKTWNARVPGRRARQRDIRLSRPQTQHALHLTVAGCGSAGRSSSRDRERA
jgi:hypothetical protein